MKKTTIVSSAKKYQKQIWIIFAFAMFCSSQTTNITAQNFQSRIGNSQKSDMAKTAANIVATRMYGFYSPSLELKEACDFVLTPALLIQDLVSQENFTTYPEE